MKYLLWSIVFALLNASTLSAQNQKADPCPLTVQDVEKVFGSGFKFEKSEFGAMVSCRYKGKKITVMVSSTPLSGMSVEKYRQMMKPKNTVFTLVPNDPDSAAVERRVKDDTDGPRVSYVRNGMMVELSILGVFYDDFSKIESAIKEMNAKLIKLRRVP